MDLSAIYSKRMPLECPSEFWVKQRAVATVKAERKGRLRVLFLLTRAPLSVPRSVELWARKFNDTDLEHYYALFENSSIIRKTVGVSAYLVYHTFR
jgi:hypothetical protein